LQENQRTPRNGNGRYLTASKGIYSDFVPDCNAAISALKTAAFNRSATPPGYESLTGKRVRGQL